MDVLDTPFIAAWDTFAAYKPLQVDDDIDRTAQLRFDIPVEDFPGGPALHEYARTVTLESDGVPLAVWDPRLDEVTLELEEGELDDEQADHLSTWLSQIGHDELLQNPDPVPA